MGSFVLSCLPAFLSSFLPSTSTYLPPSRLSQISVRLHKLKILLTNLWLWAIEADLKPEPHFLISNMKLIIPVFLELYMRVRNEIN